MKPEAKLAAWSEAWVRDGIITATQRDAILARHAHEPGASGNRFLVILCTVGGALFLVGVSLVIKSNWVLIHDWVKIGGLAVLLAASYGIGWRLKVSPGAHPRLGDACFMIGGVVFLLGIALVSQVFHLDSRPANGVLLWWVGIAALPWLVRAKGMQFVSVVAGLVWLGLELHAKDSLIALETGVYTRNADYRLMAAFGVIGVGLTSVGLALRRTSRADFAGVHEGSGLVLLCAALYGLGFTWANHRWQWEMMPGVRGPAMLAVGLPALVAVTWAWRRNREEVKLLGWMLPLVALPLGAHLLGIDLFDAGWLWGGIACLALFLFNLGMIRVGLASGRESWINLGIAFLALNIVTRYFVLFGSMLDGGLFFITSGLLVLGLGWYLERKRRRLVGAARGESRL